MIKDDPIVDCMLRTGEPPWMLRRRILTPFGYAYVGGECEEEEEEELDDEQWEDEYQEWCKRVRRSKGKHLL